jgi:hypothetical protein
MVIQTRQDATSTAHRADSISGAGFNLIQLATPERVIALISVLTGLVLWFVVTSFQWVSPLFLPSPAAVAAAFGEILRDGYKGSSLLFHIYASLLSIWEQKASPVISPKF